MAIGRRYFVQASLQVSMASTCAETDITGRKSPTTVRAEGGGDGLWLVGVGGATVYSLALAVAVCGLEEISVGIAWMEAFEVNVAVNLLWNIGSCSFAEKSVEKPMQVSALLRRF